MMMQLPTASGPEPVPAEGDVVAMASRLELRRRRDLPAFLWASLRLRRRFASSPGGIRLDLAAEPVRRTFWTLSTWTGEEGLRAFAASPLHRRVMQRFGPVMAGSTFTTWTEPGDGARSGWEAARTRLTAAAAAATDPPPPPT